MRVGRGRGVHTLIYSRIAGTGSYLPEKVVTNADLEKIVETTDEWIASRTGIRERRRAADGETTGDLAFYAATHAFEAAGVKASEIDLIVLGTTTPDLIFPSTACLLQHRLGANGCAAFDVNAACSGFLYALGVADQFVRGGQSKKALVVGSETLSRMIDWTDRSTCVLFGDGAGAVVLEASSEPGIITTKLHADGGYKHLLYNPVGVSAGFLDDEPNHGIRVMMTGNEVFKVAVKTLDRIVGETLEAANMHESRRRLADSASGEPAHHRGDSQAPEAVDGSRRRHRRSSRQYVVGFGAARARRSRALGQDSARAERTARSVRRRIYLGVGVVEVLKKPEFADSRIGMSCPDIERIEYRDFGDSSFSGARS